ncbi:MAG: hypothetical protein HQL71_14490 [Magnetococcales bacterium]|nr:hypothetical protein [Magnetococcales bacterium]
MAAAEAMIFKINGVNQTSQVAGLTGKTFTVGKVSAAGKTGLSKWLFLHPVAAGKQGSVALKIEGTNQISQLSGLAGKTVTVGQSPATVGGTGKFLLLNTGKGAAAAATGTGTGVAAAAKGSSASKMVLVKAENARQIATSKAFAGKSYTVMKPPMVAGAKTSNWMFLKPASGAGAAGEKIVAIKVQAAGTKSASTMVGKSFVVSKAPMAAGAAGPQWLAFKPVAGGMASKGAIASTVAMQGKCPLVATPVALNGNGAAAGAAAQNSIAQTGAATAGKAATTAQAAKAASAGTIWKGTGLSLGLGLGLGAWGPLLLVGAAAFGVGVYGYMRNNPTDAEGNELADLTLEG